jgi:hypothetical protein
MLYVNDNKLKEFRFFYDPAIFLEHGFWSNPPGCSITVAYDKKNSIKAKKFVEDLKIYKRPYSSSINYADIAFKLEEME